MAFGCGRSFMDHQLLASEAENALHRWARSSDSEKTVTSLLDSIIDHHTSTAPQSSPTESIQHSQAGIEEWTIPARRFEARPHSLYVHTVDLSCEQQKSDTCDRSFSGSAKLWTFVRLLWRSQGGLINTGASQREAQLARIVALFSKWGSSGQDASISMTLLARRQQLVSFVNEIMANTPSVCTGRKMEDLIKTLETFGILSGSVGDCYSLVNAKSRAVPAQAMHLVEYLSTSPWEQLSDAHSHSHRLRPASCLMWMPAHPRYTIRWISTARVLQKDSSRPSYRMLELCVDTESGISGALALLDTLSTMQLRMLSDFLRCHGTSFLVDVLLRSVNMKASTVHDWHRVVTSSLRVLTKCLQLNPNVVRFFIADPRLIHAVKSNVFATKREVQVAAVELLNALIRQSTMIATTLRHAEDWSTPTVKVKSWMIEAVQSQTSRLQLGHLRSRESSDAIPLNRKQLVQLAHLMRLPLFSRADTVELARLCMAFSETRLVDNDSFSVLLGDARFAVPVPWMSLPAASDHIQVHREGFAQDISKRKAAGVPLLMNSMPQSLFLDGCGQITRSAIAREISLHFERADSSQKHPTCLVRRCHRFLVEDRAEIVRRVTFKKNLNQADVMSQFSRRCNDTLSMLAAAPVFEGISLDSLACLALALGEPAHHRLNDVTCGHPRGLLLLLIYSANVKAHIQLKSRTMTRHLKRGDIVAYPQDKDDSRIDLVVDTSPSSVRMLVISDNVLHQELEPHELQVLRDRCRLLEKSSDAVESYKRRSRSFHRRDRGIPALRSLQFEALTMMALLAKHTTEKALTVAQNTGAVRALLDVVHSDLDDSLVEAALDVIATITRRLTDVDFFAAVDHWCFQDVAFGDTDRRLLLAVSVLQTAVSSGRCVVNVVRFVCDTLEIARLQIDGSLSTHFLSLLHKQLQENGASRDEDTRTMIGEIVVCCASILHSSDGTARDAQQLLHRLLSQLEADSVRHTLHSLTEIIKILVRADEGLEIAWQQWTWLPSVIETVTGDLAVVARGGPSKDVARLL